MSETLDSKELEALFRLLAARGQKLPQGLMDDYGLEESDLENFLQQTGDQRRAQAEADIAADYQAEKAKRIETLAKTLSQQLGLSAALVEEGPYPAWVHGKTLFFSREQIASKLRNSKSKDAKPIVYKEIAHAVNSDLGLMDLMAMAGNGPGNMFGSDGERKAVNQIFNALEDVRVEDDLCKDYEGIDSELETYIERVGKVEQEQLEGQKGVQQVVSAMYIDGRYPKTSHKYVSKDILDVARNYSTFTDAAKKARTSEEVLKIAIDLFKQFKNDSKDPEKDFKDSPNFSQEGMEKDLGGNSGASVSNKSGEQIAKALKQGTHDARQSANQIRTHEVNRPLDLPTEFKVSPENRYFICPGVKDRVLPNADGLFGKVQQRQRYSKSYQAVSSQARVFSRKVKDLFILRKKTRYIPGYTSGQRIDVTSLPKIENDCDKLFLKRYKEAKEDMVVTVLVDMSGSMQSKCEMARQAAIVLSETLNALKIPFEILGFTTNGSRPTYFASQTGKNARCEGVDHFVFKAFDDPYDEKVKTSLGGICATGGTADGEAVLWAYNRMKRRREERKYIWVLSDGQPAVQGVEQDVSGSFIKDIVRNIERQPGFTVIGLGLEDNNVSKIYRRYTVIQDCAELPIKFIKLLRTCITEETKQRG